MTMAQKSINESTNLQAIFSVREKCKSTKTLKHPKFTVPTNVSIHREVPIKSSTRTEDVVTDELDNITQTFETLNACDTPPNENSIDKLLSDITNPEKPLNDPSIDIYTSTICKDVVQDIENILTKNLIEEKEYSKEELGANQDDGNKEVNNNANEIPQIEENDYEEIFFSLMMMRVNKIFTKQVMRMMRKAVNVLKKIVKWHLKQKEAKKTLIQMREYKALKIWMLMLKLIQLLVNMFQQISRTIWRIYVGS